MGQWGLLSQTANANLNNTNFPALCEDSGKIYCKGQGEYDINVFDIAANTWSQLVTLPTATDNTAQLFTNSGVSGSLIFVNGNYLYILGTGLGGGFNQSKFAVGKYLKSTGVKVSFALFPAFNSVDGSGTVSTGVWGTDMHKSVVKTLSNRIFIIHWTYKQIWEYNLSTDAMVNCNVTWPTNNSWLTCAVGQAGPTACAYGDEIFLCGCFNTVENTAKYLFSLDTSTMTFSSRALMGVNFGTYAATWYEPKNGVFFALGNTLYWYGGYYDATNASSGNNNNTVTKLMQFNPSTNIWSQGPDLPTTPYEKHSVIVKDSAAYLIGGTISGSAAQATNAFTYQLDKPTGLSAVYDPYLNQITVSWTDNSAEESFYVVERKRDDELVYSVLSNSLPPNTTSYVDTSIDIHSHWYSYRVYCSKVL
jgi:hypothetical protein